MTPFGEMIFAASVFGYIGVAVLTYGMCLGRLIWTFPRIADDGKSKDFHFSLICGAMWPLFLPLEVWAMYVFQKTPLVFDSRLILIRVTPGCVIPAMRHVLDEQENSSMVPVILTVEVLEWLEENGCAATFRGNILFRTEEQRVEFVLRFGGK